MYERFFEVMQAIANELVVQEVRQVTTYVHEQMTLADHERETTLDVLVQACYGAAALSALASVDAEVSVWDIGEGGLVVTVITSNRKVGAF